MQKHLGHHARDEEPHEADGEPEARPVMSVLQDVQCVALEVNVAVEVFFMEGLHWDLIASIVLLPVFFFMEGKVVVDWFARKLRLFILTRREGRGGHPEGG